RRSVRLFALSANTWKRSRWRAITSRVFSPMEPVAPSTTTRRRRAGSTAEGSVDMDTGHDSDSGKMGELAGVEQPQCDREHGRRREYTVDAVEHTAVAGKQAA